jgi:hypothetical protein
MCKCVSVVIPKISSSHYAFYNTSFFISLEKAYITLDSRNILLEGTSLHFSVVHFNFVYNKLNFESCVHRVPLTETIGCVHASTTTVAIMPEVDHFDICVKFYDMNSLFLFQWHSRPMTEVMWLLIQKIFFEGRSKRY